MYPTSTLQGLTSIIGPTGTRQLLNGLNEQINAQTFGATGRGDADDSTGIQAAFNHAATITGRNKVLVIPAGDYLVQDRTPGTHVTTSDGVLYIPPGAGDLTIIGYGARLVLGPNGAGTAVLRIFGGRVKVLGLEIDLNGRIPAGNKANVAIQVSGSHPNSVAGVDGCDCLVRDCYIHGSRYRDEYTTGTIEYDHTGNAAGSRVVLLTGGTWPLLAATNGVIKIGSTWYAVSARLSDTVLQLGSGSNPGGDVGAGASYTFRGEPYRHQGRDGIQILNGFRNRVINNVLHDIGWTAIRSAGGDNEIFGNNVKNQRGNGIRILEHTGAITVEKNHVESAYCTGRSCVIADAGSAADGSVAEGNIANALTNNDVRVDRLVLRNNTARITADGDFEGAGSALKIAAVRSCLVDGGEYYAGTAINNLAVRLEDSITKIEFRGDFKVVGEFNQAPVFVGAVTTETSSNTATYIGMSQLTMTGHGLVTGKSVYLTNSQIARLNNREFIVIERVDADNVIIGEITNEGGTVVPVAYTGGTITDTQAHAGTHELILQNGTIQRGQHNTNYMMRGIFAPHFSMERVKLEMLQAKSALVKESALNTAYASDLGMQVFRVVNNEFIFNTDKLCRCIKGDNDALDSSASVILLTAGKIICYGNRFLNRSTGTVLLVNKYESNDSTASYDDRLIIFSTVGEDPHTFWSTGVPSESVVTWNDGDELRNSAPAANGTPGWICTTPGKPATFKARSSVAS